MASDSVILNELQRNSQSLDSNIRVIVMGKTPTASNGRLVLVDNVSIISSRSSGERQNDPVREICG